VAFARNMRAGWHGYCRFWTTPSPRMTWICPAPLKGAQAGFWSITVSGNWRVIFRFVEGGVELVDYLDYH